MNSKISDFDRQVISLYSVSGPIMKNKTPPVTPDLSDKVRNFFENVDHELVSEFMHGWLKSEIPPFDADPKTFSDAMDEYLECFLMEKAL